MKGAQKSEVVHQCFAATAPRLRVIGGRAPQAPGAKSTVTIPTHHAFVHDEVGGPPCPVVRHRSWFSGSRSQPQHTRTGPDHGDAGSRLGRWLLELLVPRWRPDATGVQGNVSQGRGQTPPAPPGLPRCAPDCCAVHQARPTQRQHQGQLRGQQTNCACAPAYGSVWQGQAVHQRRLTPLKTVGQGRPSWRPISWVNACFCAGESSAPSTTSSGSPAENSERQRMRKLAVRGKRARHRASAWGKFRKSPRQATKSLAVQGFACRTTFIYNTILPHVHTLLVSLFLWGQAPCRQALRQTSQQSTVGGAVLYAPRWLWARSPTLAQGRRKESRKCATSLPALKIRLRSNTAALARDAKGAGL